MCISRDVQPADLRCCRWYINGRTIESDTNCVLPLQRLAELAREGFIDEVAPRHISTMGYVLHTDALEQETSPAVARSGSREMISQ